MVTSWWNRQKLQKSCDNSIPALFEAENRPVLSICPRRPSVRPSYNPNKPDVMCTDMHVLNGGFALPNNMRPSQSCDVGAPGVQRNVEVLTPESRSGRLYNLESCPHIDPSYALPLVNFPKSVCHA